MKLAVLPFLLLAFTAHAEEKPKPLAICTTYGTGLFFGGAKYEFFGFGDTGATVKVSGIDEDGRGLDPVTVPSNLRLHTWVTYRADFEVRGHHLNLVFSNYQSPNVGKMRVDGGEPNPVACAIPEFNQ